MIIHKNPITVVGTLARCWLFVYRTPARSIAHLLPEPFELVTLGDNAFWNVVVSQVQNMRPQGLPIPVGINYWHVAYRLYAKFVAPSGQVIEGLYFVRSDCDNPLMTAAGNALTEFNFHSASVSVDEGNQYVEIIVKSDGADGYARINRSLQANLESTSVFGSLDEASRFLKYKPAGLSVESTGIVNIVHVTRDEQAWKSRLVFVEEAKWRFFDKISVVPEICYEVDPIFYQWNKAELYSAKPT